MAKKTKKYKRRKYGDKSYVIYTSAGGHLCECKTEEDSKLLVDALNHYDEHGKV